MNVACDIDGVLAETWGPAHAALVARGYDVEFETCLAAYDGFRNELIRLGHEPDPILADIWWEKDFLANLPFILPSLPGLRRIRGLCERLVMLTARKVDERPWVADVTLGWLDRYGIDHDGIAFVRSTDKVNFCLQYGYQVLIEDHPETAHAAAKAGIHAILVDYVWNRHVPEGATGFGRGRVTRVTNLIEAANVLQSW